MCFSKALCLPSRLSHTYGNNHQDRRLKVNINALIYNAYKWFTNMFCSISEIDCSLNQSKVEEITIQEEPMKVTLLEDYLDDEGFGDMFESGN